MEKESGMENQRYLPLVIEHTQEMIFLFDKDGRILEANKSAEKELGYEPDELYGEGILTIFPAISECKKEEGMAFFTKEELLNTSAYRKNKTCFAVDLRMTILDAKKGLYLITAINVAERDSAIKGLDRAKDESEQVVRIRNEFVSNVTHELRTPLNGILGHAKNLLEQEERSEQRKTLEWIIHCCEDMKQVINNILDFSDLESGRYALQEKKFKIKDTIDRVAAAYMEKINEKGLQLKLMIDDSVPKCVIGDEQKLAQVLKNLLSNAVKFTLEGEIIVKVIQTLQLKDSVELFFLVIDSGIGIKEADKDKIFQSFSQADGSSTRKYGGTGLGLTICKELIELMQGTIHVESEEGKGSTFSFSVLLKLPSRQQENEKKEADWQLLKRAEEHIYSYYTPENQKELREELDKILLCIDMENWEKAEQFAIEIKELVQGKSEAIRRAAFRMEMAVRKANEEKVMTAYQQIEECLEKEKGGI